MRPDSISGWNGMVLGLLIGLLGFLILSACSSPSGQRAFDLFIDKTVDETPPRRAEAIKARFVHSPFAKKHCDKCHVSDDSERLLHPLPALCFQCHKDFRKKFDEDRVHAPVLEGDCLACHEPHQSAITNRLRKTVAQLCYDCHDRFKAASIHAPVEEGDCQACHAPHGSTEPGLLRKPGDQICFDCHDRADMDKVRDHKAAPGRRCTECHDPHAGPTEQLLKPNIRKSA